MNYKSDKNMISDAETSRLAGAPDKLDGKFEGMRFSVDYNAIQNSSSVEFNVKSKIQNDQRAKCPGFALGTPVMSPDSTHAFVSTDNVDAKSHYVAMLEMESMQRAMKSTPMKSFVQLPEVVTCMVWSTPTTAICATGPGHIALLEVNVADQTMKVTGDANGVHTDAIREIATMPDNPHIFASGGFDNRLCLVDLSRRHVLQKLDTAQIVGSVRWGALNGACVAATTDTGKYYLFDIRTSWAKPALSINTNHPDLYTSERFSTYDVLLGYGSGRITHVDLRARKELSQTMDPFVDTIGSINYNFKADAFVVSGVNDFSVWRRDDKSNTAQFFNHGLPDRQRRNGRMIYTVCGVWAMEDMILSADSEGSVAVSIYDWSDMCEHLVT